MSTFWAARARPNAHIDPMVGFGGTKMSGYGAKGSAAHMDSYLYTKCVYIDL